MQRKGIRNTVGKFLCLCLYLCVRARALIFVDPLSRSVTCIVHPLRLELWKFWLCISAYAIVRFPVELANREPPPPFRPPRFLGDFLNVPFFNPLASIFLRNVHTYARMNAIRKHGLYGNRNRRMLYLSPFLSLFYVPPPFFPFPYNAPGPNLFC